MTISFVEILSAAVACCAVCMCGLTGITPLLRLLALQTAVIAAITALLGARLHEPHYFWLAAVVLMVKAAAIPAYLSWAAGRMHIRRDAGIVLNPMLALLIGGGLLTAGYFLAPRVAVPALGNVGAAGMAVALLFIGMLLMLTRRLALSQIAGFLVLENGIFLYGLTQTHGMPLMVEMGVVFDVLVGVMVAGLVIFRLNRSFEHIDVTQLRGLRH